MQIGRVLSLIFAIAITALIIVGLVDFDLFLSIGAKALVAVVIVGILVTVVRTLFGFK